MGQYCACVLPELKAGGLIQTEMLSSELNKCYDEKYSTDCLSQMS